MFVFTMGKNALRRAGMALLCMTCIAGALVLAGGRSQVVSAGAGEPPKITSTQDIAGFFTGFGIETDLSTAAVDRVKIPRRWDDSFSAFNTVVAESGLSLEKYRGKKAEKWTMLCPGLSGGETAVYAVLLTYREKAIGAYLVSRPGGEVSGLEQARQTAAELAETAQSGQEVFVWNTHPEAAQTGAAVTEMDDWPTE